jgi:hypothetical protein
MEERMPAGGMSHGGSMNDQMSGDGMGESP